MSQSHKNEIPDGETLLRYCDPRAFPPGQQEIPTSIFNDPELSCDWQRYRPDPLSSFHIAEGKTKVIAITVCDAIRNPRNPKRVGEVVPAWRQQIIHSPVAAAEDPMHGANPAHSLIIGKKKKAVQDAIVSNSKTLNV